MLFADFRECAQRIAADSHRQIERGCIGRRINAFANYVGVQLHDGHPWQLSTHQFRKSFARFIARRDRSQLLGLAQHFKHVSIAMTAKGYRHPSLPPSGLSTVASPRSREHVKV